MNDSNHDSNQQQPQGPSFTIQRLYTKDLSFETPNSPDVFKEKWKPEVEMDLNHESKKLEEHLYDINLRATVTVKTEGKTAFLVEVNQAGIFELKDFGPENLEGMIEIFCPNILYPYLREVVSDLIIRGGFPPLYLQPVNFEALYHQKKSTTKEKEKK